MGGKWLADSHSKAQVVVPDLGFYGRDCHVGLIREGRLIAGVNHLGELPAKLRQAALLMDEKVPSGTTLEDAETLAEYAGLVPGTIGFTDSGSGGVINAASARRPVCGLR